MSRTCPECFGTIPDTDTVCPHCGAGGERHKRARKSYADRKGEIARSNLYSTTYRKARQFAIDRTGGLCASCGTPVAARHNGRWTIIMPGGSVHHITKRIRGGADTDDNLVLLCPTCHKHADKQK